MGSVDLETKISSFLRRKQAEFPELPLSGRQGSRTLKYAHELRASGQVLMTR
ncbi:MAG TPA: hypothetical protein VLE99_03615 [Candidatus Saccharimonadales bacterium]|nr:hypothetical protein [Candidatus Saccharimonadales bacterium]